MQFSTNRKKISNNWIESEWVVLGLTPDSYVKKAFFEYINDIKINTDKPYTLYNSWYDLRGDQYPVGSYVKELFDTDYMGTKNASRLYQSFRKNFIDKHNVRLDAFVLDDGWDVYESPWLLNKKAFPNGLSPIINTFKESNTQLGMWFGPSGGYSARMKRIHWFQKNGYEVVGEEKKWGGAMLCLAGKKYSKTFKERTLQFIKEGVSYYKWDGFQFSCSEISHGHPIGIYSQIAVLDTLISSIQDIHKINPKAYHSVTSGTWLSPWWLKHANQIWMQGEDYGYADVPSYSQRDAAITYRDLILYDDFKKKNYWFPMSNMMTHGIIKGKLERLHLTEPIDKFTDNAILYFARGISMYELYTSPDIMSEKEWESVALSLKWAKHNFDTLMHTEMIGGNPENKQTYGFLHLKDNKGIIAARNPYILKQSLTVELSSKFGLDPNAKNLILEQVYPKRWISPKTYTAKDTLSIDLQGYETAIYEIYSQKDCNKPLPIGVPFETETDSTGNWIVNYHVTDTKPQFLNKELIESIEYKNQSIPISLSKGNQITFKKLNKENTIEIELTCPHLVNTATLGFLLTSNNTHTGRLPKISMTLDHKTIQPLVNGNAITKDFKMPKNKSAWYSYTIKKGKHKLVLKLEDSWSGNIDVWSSGYQPQSIQTVKIKTKSKINNDRVLPPKTYSIENAKIVKKIGAITIN